MGEYIERQSHSVSRMANDWRLQGQEKYLHGITLFWKKYRRYSEAWDHDHCEFCGSKFAEQDAITGALHEGYATADNYRWICTECFNDFKDRFAWWLKQGG